MFTQFLHLLDKFNNSNSSPYSHIFGFLLQQVQIVQDFYKIYQITKHIIQKYLTMCYMLHVMELAGGGSVINGAYPV